MTGNTDPLEQQTVATADRLPAGWWLWLPVAAALFLLVSAQAFPASYEDWIGSELGVLEFLHIAIPAISMILALRLLFRPESGRYRFLRIWLSLAVLGLLFIAGEEASWGQHYLQWDTPETWQRINDQGETNLHNTSSWLDQKPRTLLEMGIIIGGLIIPLAALRWPAIRRHRLAIILPPMVCLPSAALAEVIRLSERILDKTAPGTQLFYRASEIQELYFYLFILLYLIILRRRLLTARPAP